MRAKIVKLAHKIVSYGVIQVGGREIPVFFRWMALAEDVDYYSVHRIPQSIYDALEAMPDGNWFEELGEIAGDHDVGSTFEFNFDLGRTLETLEK